MNRDSHFRKLRQTFLGEQRSREKAKRILEEFEKDPEKQQPALKKAHDKRERKKQRRLEKGY